MEPLPSHKALQGCVVRLRKALGAEAIETSAQGYRLRRARRRGRLPEVRADGRTRSRELLALGEPERAAYLLSAGAGAVAGRGLRGRGVLGPCADRGGQAGRAAAGGRGTARRRGRCARDGTLTCLAVAESMVKAAPLRERRWTCSPGRSTSPAARPRRCAPSIGSSRCSRTSSALTPGRTGSARGGDPAAGRRVAGTRVRSRPSPDLPVPRSDAVRRRRLRVVLRPRRRRACLPRPAQDPQRVVGGGSVR